MEDLRKTLEEIKSFYRQRRAEIVASLLSLPRGHLRKREINGRVYFYLQYRKEGRVFDEYIGKETLKITELLKVMEKRKKLLGELKKIKEAFKMLKEKEGEVDLIEPVRNLLEELTRQGLWEEGLEIVGAWCFMLYQKYLSFPFYPLRTRDIDILIPLPYRGKEFNIAEYLKRLGFDMHFNPDNSMYFVGYGLKIEFLAPQKGKRLERAKYIKKLGVTPQYLRLMDVLLRDTMVLKIEGGIKVRVPSPAAFFLHKVLVARKRPDQGKREKDLKHAIYTAKYILQNAQQQEKTIKLFENFPGSWKKRVEKALKEAKEYLPEEERTVEAIKGLLRLSGCTRK